MENESVDNELHTKDGEIISKELSSNELEGITAIVEGVVTPFAKAQEISEQELTKRTTVMASVANTAIYALSVISILIVILAGYAISIGSSDIAEKMIIGLLIFFGGIGAGKASSK